MSMIQQPPISTNDDHFFTELANTKPFYKAALEGFAGSGKSLTASLIAIGMHQHLKSDKPVIIFDTEKAAQFLRPVYDRAGVPVQMRSARSLADLVETMRRLRAGYADILVIDSISHVWEDFLRAYQVKVRRTKLQFDDWGPIKSTWKQEFSEPFVNDPYSIIMCGRAGYEYENEKNEETGKREIYKSGVKMKVEGETAYEPDVLILMERFEKVLGDEKEVWREATVIKDRSQKLDGKSFRNPKYDDFAPAIEAVLANPALHLNAAPEGDATLLFKTEEERSERKRERDKAIEEIEGLLVRAYPGSTGKDRQMRMEVLDQVFGTTSDLAIKELKIDTLREGWKKIAEILVARGIAAWSEVQGRRRLEVKAIALPPAADELEEKAPPKPATDKKVNGDPVTRAISQRQLLMITILANSVGWKRDELAGALQKHKGIPSIEEIPANRYEEICDFVEAGTQAPLVWS
jgi:hypothetical protein